MNCVRPAIFLLALAWGAPVSLAFECGFKEQTFTVPPGETIEDDQYRSAQSIDISGVIVGDLFSASQSLNISGDVQGDLFGFAQFITIGGRVHDSVRAFGNTLTLDGEIDGDLLVFAATVSLAPESRITGDVLSFGGQVMANGEIGGDLLANGGQVIVGGRVGGRLSGTAGEVLLTGTVEQSVDLTCDTLRLEPTARIGGDLDYRAREPAVADLGPIVGGEVRFDVKPERGDDEENGGFATSRWLFRLGLLVASLVVGWVLIAIFRNVVPTIERAVEREAVYSLGIGFVIAVVAPVAGLLVSLGVVTIPLSAIALTVYLIALYLAKLPVALWIGGMLLRRVGLADPSPYLGLLIGLVLLSLLFWIPFWLGWLVYLVTIFLGLGALILGVRAHIHQSGPTAQAAAVS